MARPKEKLYLNLCPARCGGFAGGQLLTVLFGIIYFIQLLHREPDTWPSFFKWLAIVLVFYAVIFGLLRPVSGALNNGWILAAIVGVLVIVFGIVILTVLGSQEPALTREGTRFQYMSNRSLIDRDRWGTRRDDVTECLGNHLASSEANHCLDRR